MKHNHLKEAVLLGLAMEMAACTTSMAKDMTGQITEGEYKDSSIILNSEGSGIKAEKTNSITLTATSGNNEIWFNTDDGSKGNGIIVKEDGSVYLQATDSNKIQGKNEKGDGIQFNANTSTTAEVGLNAVNNTIIVAGDGIHDQYDEDKDLKSQGSIILTATTGSNTIDAGQNGINHEGQNTITLEAEAGNNSIQGDEDGIQLASTSGGTVELTGKENTIISNSMDKKHAGIYITEGSEGTVSITAKDSDAEGISNTVTGKNGMPVQWY